MAEDIRDGFKKSKERANAFDKYNKVKNDYNNFIQTNTDKLQKKSDSIQLNLDSASISRKIKNKTSDSFQELIDLISTSIFLNCSTASCLNEFVFSDSILIVAM